MASTMPCPRCGTENPADSRFCDQCSLPLQEMVRPPAAATLVLPTRPAASAPAVSAPPPAAHTAAAAASA
ncbi:MAG: zinc ribbon domain-containing protein, partial [Chloroflexota bacterium]|nr:zinc ribbon domain-containing protein [Chloroflexota bacterium]